MMKLSKTGIGLLTNQYRSVLRKCALINAGLFLALAPVEANAVSSMSTYCLYKYGLLGCSAVSLDGNVISGEYIYSGNPHYLELNQFGLSIVDTTSHRILTPNYDAIRADGTNEERVLGFSLYNILVLDEELYNVKSNLSSNYFTKSDIYQMINALDNNYYRNIEFSRAEKLKKTSAVIVRSAKHDVTIFERKSDKTALCAEILQSLRSFRMTESVANDNTVTTGNTTMYKKEA